MKATLAGLLLLCILLLSCGEKEQKDDARLSPLVSRIDSLLIHENREDRFHGTMVIGIRDSIIYSKAIGVANRVWDIPMQLEHRFDIASLNKSFLAAMVLLAVQEGKLNLNDKLRELLKNYKYSGRFDPNITIHHLLTHTAGLPDYDRLSAAYANNNYLRFKRLHLSDAEYVDFISQLAAVGQPGEQFYYSNFAYHLLAIMLEDAYQKPFPELLEEKICKPLQLSSTFAATSNQQVHKDVVEGYNYDEESKQWERNNFIDLNLGRRIFSSAPDLHKWAVAMNNESLLTKESLAMMQTNHLADIAPGVSYGYGWAVFDGKKQYQMGNLMIDQRYLIHGGATEGYKSLLVNIEEGAYIIALLSNAGSQTNEIALAQKVINILTNPKHEN